MPLILQGATSGSTTIQATDAVTQTITLPNNTGTVLTTASTFGGTGPAFFAFANAGTLQSISDSTWTKVTLGGELFDTNSNFASSRFTPTVAGYYQINASASNNWTTTGPKITQVAIYKNGSVYVSNGMDATYWGITPQLYNGGQLISSIVYLNGSTDYVEMYVRVVGATLPSITQGQDITNFSGAMIRSA
jgi:hypothetical protein